ncbi:glycoside hydrolase N-terminal domain-containing protein [Cellulomonas sp. JZ18]|uniref:glycosyl hydrolase family 95 catalytic domain-containing protein n=1 Tax=Cellulomonas sp. JZ18 TaxID=2654191 RepID=UPI0018AFE403|nr:glycoside hydrolase N-terminal domain-containing protein [Cellulomonas sp. JZ18]
MDDAVDRTDERADEHDLVLRLDAPARVWTDAFPVGGGRIGAMVHGGAAHERLQVNDDTCWSGAPGSPVLAPLAAPEGPAAVLAATRRALAEGDVPAAERHVRRLQSGYSAANQPLVDLLLTHPAADGAAAYRRVLDLAGGVATTTWTADDARRWRQDVLVSHPDRVLLLDRRTQDARTRDARGQDVAAVALTSPHPWVRPPAPLPDGRPGLVALVRMPAHVLPDYLGVPDAVSYDGPGVLAAVAVAVVTDGSAAVTGPDGDALPPDASGGTAVRVTGAGRVRVLLATASDHLVAQGRLHGDADRVVADALADLTAALADLDAVPARHAADHRALMGRVHLDLGAPAPDAPLDARLVAHASGTADPHLAVLAFQLGRYLTVAGSRPGTLPLHLQGVWNPHVQPPWNANYTININTEMNYWPTLVGDLAECHEPLLSWLDRLAVAGERTARELYGARGWVAHHNSDPWCFTAPVGAGQDSPSWSTWPFGGVWLARHVLDHHDWTGDDEALRRHWPVVRGAALFVLDWLVELPDGTLGTAPATSPENQYLLPDGTVASVGVSTASDLAMARDLLEHVRRLAPVAGDHDEDLRAAVDGALERVPTERVAPDGRLAEWSRDVPDAEPEHRHQSHLYRVFPGTSIDPDASPALAAAARRTLDARGPDSTGWSLAWRLALRARLRDPQGVAELVDAFLNPVDADLARAVGATRAGPAPRHVGGVYRGLLCAHPPFQVDGNLGFTAGVAEALVQAHRLGADGVREVHLLPALPAAWADGRVRGLRLRGGLRVDDLVWRAGRVVDAVLRADRPAVVDVRSGTDPARRQLALPAGTPVRLPRP